MRAMELAQAELQRAAALLEREGDATLGAVASQLVAALDAVYLAIDRRADPLEAVVAGRRALAAAVEGLAPPTGRLAPLADHLRHADARLAEAEEARSREQPSIEHTEESRVVASGELPRLHPVARVPRITLRLAEVPPPAPPDELALPALPRSFDELDGVGARIRAAVRAHLDRAFEHERPPSAGPCAPDPERRFEARWARECFDEVAMLASQRTPLLGDDWRATRDLEGRLNAAIDAFASLAPTSLSEIEPLVIDAPAPDPERCFAAALLCACFASRAALGLAERIARASIDDETAMNRVADGLLVAPESEPLRAMLRGWLDDDEPALRRAAAGVLSPRDWLGEDELMRVARDRPEIAVFALVALAAQRHPAWQDHAERLLPAWSARVALAVGRSRSQLAATLRPALERGDVEAALLLGMVGNQDDARAVREHAARSPAPENLAALGVAGSVEAVPLLLELLRHQDPRLALAAARALDRLTGAGLRERVALDAELVAAVDPIVDHALRRGQPGFAGTVPEPDVPALLGPKPAPRSDARSDAPGPTPDRLMLPAPDHEHWKRWWLDNRGRFEGGRRYRRGQPYTPALALDELAGPHLSPVERERTATELVVLGAAGVGFDRRAYVVEQERALARWRPIVERLPWSPGAWPR